MSYIKTHADPYERVLVLSPAPRDIRHRMKRYARARANKTMLEIHWESFGSELKRERHVVLAKQQQQQQQQPVAAAIPMAMATTTTVLDDVDRLRKMRYKK